MKKSVEAYNLGPKTEIGLAMDELRAAIAPHPLVREKDTFGNASTYWFRLDGVKLFAILEVESHDDGRRWAHLSVSAQNPKRIPTWKELRWAKEHFLGDRRAIQVLPPRSEYINIRPNVLNLYACLDDNPLPDFRMRDAVTDQVGI
jgi:hypothetical protein